MAEMTDPARLGIGGEWVEGDAGTYDVVNPATEEVVGRAPQASVAQVTEATRAAAEALPAWAATTPEERAGLLNRAAELLESRLDHFVPIVQAETGATLRVARSLQVPQAAARFRRYAKGAVEPVIDPLPPRSCPTRPSLRAASSPPSPVEPPSGW